jgi:TPR repeat protein
MKPERLMRLKEEAENGVGEACEILAGVYEDGCVDMDGNILEGVDFEKSVRWYRKAAEAGIDGAQLNLSAILGRVGAAENEYREAIYWARKLIKNGNAMAAHNLATIYRDRKKYRIAYKWYKRAVEMGEINSLLEVALCNLLGVGVRRDVNTARRILSRLLVQENGDILEDVMECARFVKTMIDIVEGNWKTSIAERTNNSCIQFCDYSIDDVIRKVYVPDAT